MASGSEPRNLLEAYAVQERLIHLLGRPVGGWKVAGTQEPARRLLRLDDRFYGRLLADRVVSSPAEVSPVDFPGDAVSVEVEVGVRIARTLAAGEHHPGAGVPEGLAAAIVPCLEVPVVRFDDLEGQGLLLVADNAGGSGAVVGQPATPDQIDRSGSTPLSVVVEGPRGEEGTPAERVDVVVDWRSVEASLSWLVGALAASGHTLHGGDLVLTGALSGVHRLGPGSRCTADFGTLGAVALAVTVR